MTKDNAKYSTAALFIFLLLMFISNSIAVRIQNNQQMQLANELLAQAETVSSQVIRSLTDAHRSKINTCEFESINKLRQIVSHYEYVYDLALVDANGRVACSANWGKLLEPKSLPQNAYVSPSGITLLSKVTNILPAEFQLNTAKLGSYVSLTMPTLFKDFRARGLNFSYDIKTKDDGMTYFSYQSQRQFPLNLSFLKISNTICSKNYSYCVNTYAENGGLLFYHSIVWFMVALVSALISVLFFYSFKSYRSASNSMEFRLKKAISNNKLYMEYQPIVSAKTGEIDKFESLVRWTDEVHGRVSPELFISLTEKLSLYPKLAHQIVEKSFSEMAPILKSNPKLGLSLNVSSYEILNNGYLDLLAKLVVKHKIHPSQINIEITEKIKVELDDLAAFSKKAKSMGFVVVLDDFGTGVANLVWLTEINFDVIKIDRVFTQALTNDLKCSMVFSILNLINDLDKTVVFEGVEMKDELEIIQRISPSALIQGWYFYKALPIQDLLKIEELSR